MTKKPQAAEMPENLSHVMKSMQQAISANPLFSSQAKHFWQAQEQMLDATEAYTRNWFERRHEATRTAMETMRSALNADGGQPDVAGKSITQWQQHSMERMVEDAREWLEMVTKCAAVATAGEIEVAEEAMEVTRRATKSAKSEPV